jgi:acrylyl-CoA reductase (NADPH)
MTFTALVLNQENGGTSANVQELEDSRLPEGDVTVRVDYSTLNYKDALAITGRAPIVRSWPMVPGIDFAGQVDSSQDSRFRPGDTVVLNGWGVGENRWGGLAQRARVPGDFLVRLPAPLTTRQAMIIGTAGYTAMLCVQALERLGVLPGRGDILVTGANGGVGGFAILLLARSGYRVVASTGRMQEATRLRALGAAEIIDRSTLSEKGKPLQKERWAGVVDSAGGHTLANACASTMYQGVVTACGLAQSMDLPATVAPFILRGVTLAGIDSVNAPHDARVAAWEALAKRLDSSGLERMLDREISLSEAPDAARELMAGQIKGRLVVNAGAGQ